MFAGSKSRHPDRDSTALATDIEPHDHRTDTSATMAENRKNNPPIRIVRQVTCRQVGARGPSICEESSICWNAGVGGLGRPLSRRGGDNGRRTSPRVQAGPADLQSDPPGTESALTGSALLLCAEPRIHVHLAFPCAPDGATDRVLADGSHVHKGSDLPGKMRIIRTVFRPDRRQPS